MLLSIKLSQVILMNMKYRLSQTGKSLGRMCAHWDTEEPRILKSLAVVLFLYPSINRDFL